MRKIKLNFGMVTGEKYYVFPLPSNNAYQEVTVRRWPKNYELVSDQSGNQLLVFSTSSPNSLIFSHKPLKVEKSLSKLEFIKVKSIQIVDNAYINPWDSAIKTLAAKFIDGETNPSKIVQSLYEETLKYLSYGQPISGLHPYSQALAERVTDCGGFSTFLASLLSNQGFKTRLAVGYLLKNTWKQQLKESFRAGQSWSDLSMHAWLEVALTDGSYLPLDAAVEWRLHHGQSQRQASFGQLPADRLVLSYGHNQQLTWQGKNYHWPILQHPEIIMK